MSFRFFFVFFAILNCMCFATPSHFIPIKNKSSKTFDLAMQLMEERDAKILVETGSGGIGAFSQILDDSSTLIFGQWAQKHDSVLYSVYEHPLTIILTSKFLDTKGIQSVKLIKSDSVKFLESFNQHIDFLYLESNDILRNNSIAIQKHHFNEVLAAVPWLSDDSIIILPQGEKGKLAIEYLLEEGWEIVSEEYRAMLVKGG